MSNLPNMKARQIDWAMLKLSALVMISYLVLLAAFSMIVQMDIEMNALEVNASAAQEQTPQH